MSKLILVRGLPGSGKSTFVKNHMADDDRHFEADMYFYDRMGEYKFYPARLGAAHNWCQTRTNMWISLGKTVWVSNTFTTKKEMQYYIDLAESCGVPLVVYSMKTQFESIHNVPEATIEKMRNRWEPYEGEIYVG